MKNILFLVFFLYTGLAFASVNDTNFTDTNRLKQGFWIERIGGNDCHGYYVDNKREGSWRIYPIGTMLFSNIESYKAGKKHGLFLLVDRSGNLLREENYSNDSLDGLRRVFYVGGKPKMEEFFKMGKLEGKRTLFYSSSVKQEEGYFKNGVRDGISRWYYEDGSLNTESNYEKGQLIGSQITYYRAKAPGSNGRNINSKVVYAANEMQGEYLEYFEDGKIKLKGIYDKGLMTGIWVEYHPNGKIKLTGNYINNKKEGTWTEFDENGKQIKKMRYKNGELPTESIEGKK